MKATRTEQQVITKKHPMWKVIDQNCFFSKNLFNLANYTIRQEFINNNRWIKYRELDKSLQQTDAYKELMSQPAQCTLQVLDREWKAFFITMKDWKQNPNKYLGRPKLPKYKDKEKGRFTWFIKNNSAYIEGDNLIFRVNRLKGYNFKTHAQGRLICVRFVPHGSHYTMEVVTEVEVPNKVESESKCIASIDLGVNNLVTLTNNIGLKPIIINGKGIKSINQYYNKQKAKLQSDLKLRNNKHWSKALETLTYKRNNRVKNFMHNVSHYIINYCIENNIDTLVCGLNKEWKQESKMSKQTNQKFIYLPYDMLINQLTYKCENVGIKFLTHEESYTSGTSFLDGEIACKENYDKSRRVKRGLFQAFDRLINSDVNGSLQILRKAFPDAFSYGIEGDLTPLIINVVKTA